MIIKIMIIINSSSVISSSISSCIILIYGRNPCTDQPIIDLAPQTDRGAPAYKKVPTFLQGRHRLVTPILRPAPLLLPMPGPSQYNTKHERQYNRLDLIGRTAAEKDRPMKLRSRSLVGVLKSILTVRGCPPSVAA